MKTIKRIVQKEIKNKRKRNNWMFHKEIKKKG
jgi:hypothetical protein